VLPGQRHFVSNAGPEDLRFMLTSAPNARADCIEADE
jgi:hypothetical protein